MNNMQHLKSSEYESIASNLDSRHQHYNPNLLVKSLSNSNLETLTHTQNTHRFIHSAANLLDLSNNETFPCEQPKTIPHRPPPPLPAKPKYEQPLIEISSDNNSGFDDDFGSLTIDNKPSVQVPIRPPPLPPLPPKAVFSLFDDSFEPIQPQTSYPLQSQPFNQAVQFSQPSQQQAPLRQNPSLKTNAPPPLPPLPTTKPLIAIPKQDSKPSYINELTSVLNANNLDQNNVGLQSSSVPPPLPPPPKLPPRIPAKVQIQTNPNEIFDDFDAFFSKRDAPQTNQQQLELQSQQVSNQANPFDPFGDSFVPSETPLPPPRMNHFS